MDKELLLDLIPSDYATAPGVLDVPSTIALGHRLISVVPDGLPQHALICLDAVKEAVTLLERRYAEAQTAVSPQSKRPIDTRADTTWSCVKSRLEPYTWLEEADGKDVAPARALYNQLFPGGSLSFILLDYNAQWAEANWRLELIERQGQLPLLRRLVGEVFVDALLAAHESYSQMLGIGREKPKPKAGRGRPVKPRPSGAIPKTDAAEEAEPLAVGELRRRALQAIVAWQLTLVTLHSTGHKGARAALLPSDEFRQRAAAGRSSPEPTPEPSAPAPVRRPSQPEMPASP